jgi:hypothetical protein
MSIQGLYRQGGYVRPAAAIYDGKTAMPRIYSTIPAELWFWLPKIQVLSP